MIENKGILFRYRILWHILFWLVCYIFYVITYGSYTDNYIGELYSNLYLLPVRVAWTYILVYYLIPALLLKRRYLTFALGFIIHAFTYGIALWLVLYYFYYCPGCQSEHDYPLLYIPKILGIITGNYEIPAIAALIKFIKNWYIEQNKNQQLTKEKLEAELKFLKSQINPHFLFNTLNNLYALTLKKSDKAPDIVIRLSKMLDYMLYESNDKEVKLDDEIRLVKDYLELEKIRYGDRLKMTFQVEGETAGRYIAPLIILPFIENSFKHGVSKDVSKPFIDIKIRINELCMELNVINSATEQKNIREEYTEGIGLKNVRRRLELQYPDKHELEIFENHVSFRIRLCIKWSYFEGKCFDNNNE